MPSPRVLSQNSGTLIDSEQSPKRPGLGTYFLSAGSPGSLGQGLGLGRAHPIYRSMQYTVSPYMGTLHRALGSPFSPNGMYQIPSSPKA